jgi:hypothetical protein
VGGKRWEKISVENQNQIMDCLAEKENGEENGMLISIPLQLWSDIYDHQLFNKDLWLDSI